MCSAWAAYDNHKTTSPHSPLHACSYHGDASKALTLSGSLQGVVKNRRHQLSPACYNHCCVHTLKWNSIILASYLALSHVRKEKMTLSSQSIRLASSSVHMTLIKTSFFLAKIWMQLQLSFSYTLYLDASYKINVSFQWFVSQRHYLGSAKEFADTQFITGKPQLW